jgi:16S rRNA (cytosine967-C5)-methyltransferase
VFLLKKYKTNIHLKFNFQSINSTFAPQLFKMRLHRNLVYTTIDSLNAIFNEGEYADKVVARALKKDKRWEALIENLLPKPSMKSYDGKIIC